LRLRKKDFFAVKDFLPLGIGGRWDGTQNDLFSDNRHTDDRQLTTDRKIDVLKLRKKDFFAVKDSFPSGIEGGRWDGTHNNLFFNN
jgi:hypothetical protein